MPSTLRRPPHHTTGAWTGAHRKLFLGAGIALSAAALAGSLQLVTGTFTPPVEDLSPLGLRSWTLPGIWLLCSVALPWLVVAWAAATRRPATPRLVLLACGALLVELIVQIPFVGPSALQAILAVPAVVLAAVARSTLHHPPAREATHGHDAGPAT